MEKNTTIIIVIVGIIIFGLGFQIGSMMRKTTGCPKPLSCPTCLLNSKVASSWMGFAKGEVKAISGKDLTLSSDGETLKISVYEKARIQAWEGEKTKEVSFGEIKIGQKIEVQFLVKPEDKTLLGSLVTIMP